MSASSAAARATVSRPAVRPATGRPVGDRRPGQPRLRVVTPERPGSRTGLALVSAMLLAAGLLGLLMLNISLSRGSYELSASQLEARKLAETRQALQEQVEAARAPEQLAAEARRLGMVPAPNTAFVRLPDGTVLGTPAEAQAPPKPKPVASATATAKPGADAKKKADAKKPAGTRTGDARTGGTKRTTP